MCLVLWLVFGLVNLGIEYFVGCMDLVILIWICKMELISKGFGCTVYMCLNQWWVRFVCGGEAVILFGFVQEKTLMDSLVNICVYIFCVYVSPIWNWFGWVWCTNWEKREGYGFGVKTGREERDNRENRGMS